MTAVTQHSVLDTVPKGLFIGGEWRDSSDGTTLAVDDPATGEILTHVADATVEDGRAALDAAVAAQSDWARTPPRDRAELLRAAYEKITERADEFAMLMAGPRLRVVLATIHLALRDVPRRLDIPAIVRAGRLLARALRDHFARPRPVVGVLGLNPHAGEQGLLGDEESTVDYRHRARRGADR